MSGTFVANNTNLNSVFQRTSAQFPKLYKRKAVCIGIKVKKG